MYRIVQNVQNCTGPWTEHRPSASLLRRADLRCESNLPRRCRSTFARRRSPEETSRSQRCNIGMHADPDSSDEEEIATRAALTAAGANGGNGRKKQPFDKNRVLLAILGREEPGAPANAMGCVPSVYRPSSRPTYSRFGWTGPVALLVLWPTCPKSIAYGTVECR